MTTLEGLTAWDINRPTQPKVQYTVAILMGNTFRIIHILTFNYINNGWIQMQTYNKTGNNKFGMLHNIKDKMTPFW